MNPTEFKNYCNSEHRLENMNVFDNFDDFDCINDNNPYGNFDDFTEDTNSISVKEETFDFPVVKPVRITVTHTCKKKKWSSLENDIRSFLVNDKRLVEVETDLVTAWNQSFITNIALKEDVIKEYILMRFGLDISSIDEVTYIEQFCDSDFRRVGITFREISFTELKIILDVIHEPWFDHQVLAEYSLEPRDTNLLLAMMKDNSYDEEELKKFTHDLDIFNQYLCAKLSNSIAKLNELHTGLTITSETYPDFLDYFYYNQIEEAKNRNIFCLPFIKKYCKEDLEESSFIVEQYASGNLDLDLFLQVDNNYYIAQILTDMQKANLEITNTLNLSVKDSFNETIYPLFCRLVYSRYSGNLGESEYLHFLAIFALDFKIVDILLITNIQESDIILSYNSFWHEYLLYVFLQKKFELPANIGSTFVIMQEINRAYISNLDALLCNYAIFEKLEIDNINPYLLSDHSGVLLSGVESFKAEQLKFLPQTKTSLETWAEYQLFNIIDIRRTNLCLLIKRAEELSYTFSDNFLKFARMNEETYHIFDRVFSYTLTHEYFIAFCSSPHSKLFFSFLSKCYGRGSSAKVIFLFIQQSFSWFFKDKFIVDKSLYNTLSDDRAFVCVKHHNSSDILGYQAFLLSLSTFFGYSDLANRVKLCVFDKIIEISIK